MDRAELEKLPTKDLHDQAMQVARHHADVRWLWEVARSLPVAEAASGDLRRSGADVVSLSSLISDFVHSGEGEVGEALRPLYIDYLAEHA